MNNLYDLVITLPCFVFSVNGNSVRSRETEWVLEPGQREMLIMGRVVLPHEELPMPGSKHPSPEEAAKAEAKKWKRVNEALWVLLLWGLICSVTLYILHYLNTAWR
jgi:hypothetical protein